MTEMEADGRYVTYKAVTGIDAPTTPSGSEGSRAGTVILIGGAMFCAATWTRRLLRHTGE